MKNFNKNLYQGSRISKFLGYLSFLLTLFGIGVLFGGHWLLTIFCISLSLVFSYVAYKLARGRKNPESYKTDSLGLNENDTSTLNMPSPVEYGKSLAKNLLESCTKNELEKLRVALDFPDGLIRFAPEAIVLQLFLETYTTEVVFQKNDDYRKKLLVPRNS